MNDSRLIENLIYTYAERIDAGELESVAELFREAAIVAPAQDSHVGGYEAVLAMYQQACRIYESTGTPQTKHLTTNVIIEVDGDEGRARSYFTVIQATDALALQPIISGRYHDTFVRSDAGWRFEERKMFVDLMGDCSAHLLYDSSALT
ncbi:nuclear transport factor 2 family protein [Halieaceae bacterium IMCC14734]|uniref:Nuclear transport factor 2 family protein n=1 Tax=Candidatus Litorirhabdus singularis TaxID=2518993 RepID=A0ABT3TJP0_9GAMM|nr:nuclear transport factor 2 family protein [Candidatus Litorirhabdus singularis]MCX2981991.1 nuclear transport factor 2 family protein [Candidatus Litorirhabdus singularis]